MNCETLPYFSVNVQGSRFHERTDCGESLPPTSLLLVLPYTGGFAGLPAVVAAGNRLPVVCTRKAGIPDHLGECGIWIEEQNPKQLAVRILELLNNNSLRCETGQNCEKEPSFISIGMPLPIEPSRYTRAP